MGSSESISVPNPNHEGSEVGFQSSQSPEPNPDLDDHAPSDPNRTAREEEKEEEEHKLLEQLEKLDLRDESEVESKVEVREDEKDWKLDLNEPEKAKSDSNVEEEEEENENEEKRGDSEWSYGYDNDNENVNEVEIGIDKEVIESGSGSEVDKKGERNGGNGRRFQSQYPVRPEAEDCPFYLKTGMCKFGTHCKFNHPVKRKIQAVKEKVKDKEEPTERPGQSECKYYLRSGGCKFGKSCRYNHTRVKSPGSTFLELNFLSLPIRPGEKECPYYMRTGSCKYGANCKFNHPDPTVVAGSDPSSGYGNGGSVSLGASQSSMASWSSPRALNDSAPFLPVVLPPTPGVPPQNSEWNGYQAPVYPPPERNMHLPQYVMNPAANQTTNVYLHQPQQIQVEEYPERPGQPECSYFLKTGDCKFKSNCKYHHPKIRNVTSPPCALSDKGLPLRPEQNICSHYSRYGICKFGPACKFDHPIDPPMTGVDQHSSYGNSVTTENAGVAGSGNGSGSDATM